MRLAAQLYTLREFTKTPADIARTLTRVKSIGYDAVQCSALGPIAPAELAKMLAGEGLTCCATHTSYDRLRDDFDHVVEEHRLWNCRYTALGGFGWKDMTAAKWSAFVDEFSALAGRYAKAGVRLGYHNHSHELIRHGDRTALAMIRDESSRDVWLELDTYWLAHGGADPAAWIESCAGRVPCVHFKDMTIAPDGKQRMAEVGAGNLNWKRILDTCARSGAEWLIVEQDDCYGADPFDCLATSFRNLNPLLLPSGLVA